jgi:cytochrome c oxidase assembly protein Cox11
MIILIPLYRALCRAYGYDVHALVATCALGMHLSYYTVCCDVSN